MDSNWLTLIFLYSPAAMSVSAALSVPTCAMAIPSVSAGHDTRLSDLGNLNDSGAAIKDTLHKFFSGDESLLKAPTLSLATLAQAKGISDRTQQSDEDRLRPRICTWPIKLDLKESCLCSGTPSIYGRILIASRRVNAS
ncbi:MAG TPA: hypothetical protein VMR02_02000 [Terracidiphilus sp.]|nr:hypothetical protein [Terracidiphilus sp.]